MYGKLKLFIVNSAPPRTGKLVGRQATGHLGGRATAGRRQAADWKRKKLDELGFCLAGAAESRTTGQVGDGVRATAGFSSAARPLPGDPDEHPEKSSSAVVGKATAFPQRLTTEQRYRLNELVFCGPEANRQVKQDSGKRLSSNCGNSSSSRGTARCRRAGSENPKLARWVAFSASRRKNVR